jgi:hypothetical protein
MFPSFGRTNSRRRNSAPIAAQEIEGIVEASIRERINDGGRSLPTETIFERIDRIILKTKAIAITARLFGDGDNPVVAAFELPWTTKDTSTAVQIEPNQTGKPDQKLLQSMVRAHAWVRGLSDGTHASIEDLATTAGLHPKVVRQALRLVFLAPDLTGSILQGSQPPTLSLATIPFALPLQWKEQHR